jgi:hypothetical protein
VGRANAIAVGDGCEALHMDAEQSGERCGFHLADLGEALGDMCYWAMVLTELFAGR